MGEFVASLWLIVLAWISALIIVSLNAKLIYSTIADELDPKTGHPALMWWLVIPVSVVTGLLLIWITIRPLVGKALQRKYSHPHDVPKELIFSEKKNYSRIAVCVDFTPSDTEALNRAIQQGGRSATYILLHVTETAGARVMNAETGDFETEFDQKELDKYAMRFREEGYAVETKLGFGDPKERIPGIVNTENVDLLVMGAHGHNFIKDMLLGTTVEKVRHRVKVPVLIVRK
jgi:manganese transport protein